MALALRKGMTRRRPPHYSGLLVVPSILSAPALRANTPINVDVERAVDRAYTVDATFDVNVPASIAWDVLEVREHDQRLLAFQNVCGKSSARGAR